MELVSFSTVLQCWSFLLHWLLAMVWYILLPYILHIWRFMVLLLTPWTPLEYFQVSNLWFSNPNYPYIQASFVSSFKTDGRYIELCFFLPNKTTKRLCLSSIFRVCPLKTAIMTIKSFPWANTMRTDRHRRRSIDRHCVAWRYISTMLISWSYCINCLLHPCIVKIWSQDTKIQMMLMKHRETISCELFKYKCVIDNIN